MLPQQTAVGHFRQLGDTNAMLVRFDMLGHDVHGNLAEVQVWTDPRRSGNPCGLQHVQDDLPGQLTGGELIGIQVVGHIHEHFVD